MGESKSLVEMGYGLGFDENTRVLDLCCSYGEMLKIWSEAFAIKGLGVELFGKYVEEGNQRLLNAGVSEKVKLLEADAKVFQSDQVFDVACLSGEDLFGGFEENVQALDQHIKSDGIIIIGTPYYKIKPVPKELIEFEGNLPTLDECYDTIKKLGYNLLHLFHWNGSDFSSAFKKNEIPILESMKGCIYTNPILQSY